MNNGMTICTSCQFANPNEMKFCGACGNALARICHACDFANPLDFRFCGQCGNSLEQQSDAAAVAEAEKDPAHSNKKSEAAERRQLTVMFCDLADSTSLSDSLDPEEFHNIIQQYQNACANVINRYGGHIAQYLGDGILVYFGYPKAHEDDPCRAVYGALGCVEAMGELNKGLVEKDIKLNIRIGIHTGLVVTAEIGTGERREQLALGKTPNIAARLQNLAVPNSVFITDTTLGLIHGFFETEFRGQHRMKGINEPVDVYHVIRENNARDRFDVALRLGGLIPMIGRENEIGQLTRLWDMATSGHGQVVLLKGESGIGKSRLMQAFIDQLNNSSHHYLCAHGMAFSESSTLRPIIVMLQNTFNFTANDSPSDRLNKLENTLAKYNFNLAGYIPLFASLLNLPLEDKYPESSLSPELRKKRTLEVVFELLQKLSQERPLLFVVEDLHWLDPSTLELLDMLVLQDPTHRILIFFTCRPNFTIPWYSRSNLIQFNLTHLSRTEIKSMVDRLTNGRGLPKVLLDEIVSKTDGVPLFVEELTKMVIDSKMVKEVDGYYQLAGKYSSLSIPSTLQDLLTARLDNLGSAKEVAQFAAIIGREFSVELLLSISGYDSQLLQIHVNRLVEAEMVFQRGVGTQSLYVFKHALIQETAMHSMLKSRRQAVHKKIALVLENDYPEIVRERPEYIAHHYSEAAEAERAIDWWLRAEQHALKQSANHEAISHFEHGMLLLDKLPDNKESWLRELRLCAAAGTAYCATTGYASPEVERVYNRASELYKKTGDIPEQFQILWGHYAFYVVRADLIKAWDSSREMLSAAESKANANMQLEANVSLGLIQYFMGNGNKAYSYMLKAIQLDSPDRDRSFTYLSGQDASVCNLAYIALALWLLGKPGQALVKSNEAISLARKLAHPFSLVYALNFAAWLHYMLRKPDSAAGLAKEVIDLSEEQGFFWTTLGSVVEGWSLACDGNTGAGLDKIKTGLQNYRAPGARLSQTLQLAIEADACLQAGELARAKQCLQEAIDQAALTDEKFWLADIYRLMGETLHAMGDNKSMDSCLVKAIDVARTQETPMLLLRAALSHARLTGKKNKQSALTLLRQARAEIDDETDLADLQEADLLLEEVAISR